MVKVKLAGARGCRRVVVADARAARGGRVLERVGSVVGGRICISLVALRSWLKAGALPSKAALKLLSKAGLV